MKQELIKIGHLMYEKDLTSATSGNISCRCGDKILITSTGSALGFLNDDEVVEIDYNGNEVHDGKKASSEKFLHLKIYQLRPDINAIIHCHSPYVTAFAVCRKELSEPIMAENILYFGKIPVADYAMPSSVQLQENTSKLFTEYSTVLMANHGIVTCAKDLLNAFYQIETAETYAKTYINSKILGNPIMLSEKEVLELYELRKKIHK